MTWNAQRRVAAVDVVLTIGVDGWDEPGFLAALDWAAADELWSRRR